MKNKWILLIIAIFLPLIVFSVQSSGFADTKRLTAKKWHSNIEIYISEKQSISDIQRIGTSSKVVVHSDITYLPNNTFIQESNISTYGEDGGHLFDISISGIGTWEYNEGYLFLELDKTHVLPLQDVESKVNSEAIERVKELMIMDMQNVRRIDILNKNTMLLTSVDNSTRILISN